MSTVASYEITCLAEALSPLSHAMGVEGNEQILARGPVVGELGIADVPRLSGNQIRHRMVREPGMSWLVEEYGLRGRLTLPMAAFLFHGGSLTKGGGREDLRRVADWQRIFPLGRLLGGCLPDQVLAGSLNCGQGVLVCRENQRRLERMLPAEALPSGSLRPAVSLVSRHQYTRGSVASSHPSFLEDTKGEHDSPGIFAGEHVIPGALFVLTFSAMNVSTAELGSLLCSLETWSDCGASLGGLAARGHGRLALSIIQESADVDLEAAKREYRAHVRSVREEAVEWLFTQFAPAKEAAEKKAKAKKGAEE